MKIRFATVSRPSQGPRFLSYSSRVLRSTRTRRVGNALPLKLIFVGRGEFDSSEAPRGRRYDGAGQDKVDKANYSFAPTLSIHLYVCISGRFPTIIKSKERT